MVPYTVQVLGLTPTTLFRLINAVPTHKYADRMADDRFNLTEVIAHIADIEDVFLDRMRKAVEFPGSEVETLDPEARAIQKRYADRDLYHELDVFQNRRNDTVDFLKGLLAEDLAKTVVHPDFGSTSVDWMADLLVSHDLYHVEQVSWYLR